MLTDGEPSDIDVRDSLYLTEDARHTVLSLRKIGVDVFAFGLGNEPFARSIGLLGNAGRYGFRELRRCPLASCNYIPN